MNQQTDVCAICGKPIYRMAERFWAHKVPRCIGPPMNAAEKLATKFREGAPGMVRIYMGTNGYPPHRAKPTVAKADMPDAYYCLEDDSDAEEK